MKMEEGDPRCGARPPEPLTQVRHLHAEDGAVAVAEPADGVDARKKDIKTVVSLFHRPKYHVWPM